MTVTSPDEGLGTTNVAALVVAVNTVEAPSTQVIVVPVCEQVVACAWAVAGNRKIAVAVETLLSKARRAFVFVI